MLVDLRRKHETENDNDDGAVRGKSVASVISPEARGRDANS